MATTTAYSVRQDRLSSGRVVLTVPAIPEVIVHGVTVGELSDLLVRQVKFFLEQREQRVVSVSVTADQPEDITVVKTVTSAEASELAA